MTADASEMFLCSGGLPPDICAFGFGCDRRWLALRQGREEFGVSPASTVIDRRYKRSICEL